MVIANTDESKFNPDGAGILWKKLLNRLPKKYWDRIEIFRPEDGLIDGCRYILAFDYHYSWHGYESVPVRSVTEAIRFIKEATIMKV